MPLLVHKRSGRTCTLLITVGTGRLHTQRERTEPALPPVGLALPAIAPTDQALGAHLPRITGVQARLRSGSRRVRGRGWRGAPASAAVAPTHLSSHARLARVRLRNTPPYCTAHSASQAHRQRKRVTRHSGAARLRCAHDAASCGC